MSKPSYTYTTLTPQKLDTLIKLSTTGFKKGPIKIKKNLSRAKELQWLRDQVWELDRACWKDGVRHSEGLFQVTGNCFCCKMTVGNPSQVRHAPKGEMEYRHHCRRCGRLVCDRCSKQYVKLWVFWDVDTEKLKACKKDEDREKMRCCDGCVRQLHAGEDEIAFQLEAEGEETASMEKKNGETENDDGSNNDTDDNVEDTDDGGVGKQKKDMKRMSTIKDANDGKNARFSAVLNKNKSSNLEHVEDSAMHAYVQTFYCQVCGGDFSFLHGWENSEMAQVNDLLMCMPCKIDKNIPMGQRTLYSVFLNDIPPRVTNEDLYSILLEYAGNHNRRDFSWKYAYCTISLDTNGMPFLSDNGLGRALVRFYQTDVQKWLLNEKSILVDDKDHFYGSADEFRLRVSKKPLLVAEGGDGYSRWGKIKLTREVEKYAEQLKREKIELRKMKLRIGRSNRRAYGGGGVLRCPGKLGGCGMGMTSQKHGVCAECGGLRVSKEQLGGGRQASYDDAIEAARMNDETRLNGIFSLQSRAISNVGIQMDSGHFTEPTFTVDNGDTEILVGKSHRGQTALHVAAASGSFESVKILLDLNYKDRKQTIEEISKNGDKRILILPRDLYGSTPLHLAAMEGHEEIVELFLSRGVSQVINNNIKRLPLHYAAANGHSEVCEMLLRASSEQLLMKDIFGKSPLDLAKANKAGDKMKALISYLEGLLDTFN